LAAVQVTSQPGQIEANHRHATPFVERAAKAGARLVVLPELFSCGYIPNRAIWAAGEPADGPTVQWLQEMAARLSIYLGAGLVETDGRDFYDVFALATPQASIAGRACKANAEAVFKRGRGQHIIDTALGRLGVGICADNQFITLPRFLAQQGIEVLLMPHAWPTPVRPAGPVSAADVEAQQRRVEDLPLLYAQLLGVPVIFVNQVGAMGRMAGLLGKAMDPEVYRLQGQSRIVAADGTLLGALAGEEGVLVEDVVLGATSILHEELVSYGGWLQPGPALVRKLIIPLDTGLGELSYSLSRERRRKARAAASSMGATAPNLNAA
jgi:N-carbamoylputrescine amidase